MQEAELPNLELIRYKAEQELLSDPGFVKFIPPLIEVGAFFGNLGKECKEE